MSVISVGRLLTYNPAELIREFHVVAIVNQQPITVKLDHTSYPIHVESNLLKCLPEELGKLANRIAFITDDVVDRFYGTELNQLFSGSDLAISKIVVESGEQSKSIETTLVIYDDLFEMKADRSTLVVAFGGGVVGDLAGFVAATFLRGLRFVQIPTTLLAQVDSSVGGKVGINRPQAKNCVGSFWQPEVVFVDPRVLDTLDEDNYTAGLAEVVKYGAIMDELFFEYLEANIAAINSRDLDVLTYIIRRCCELKAQVVQSDERETTGHRAILNFGHTFAHAIETAFGYGTILHGHAVGIGMVAASQLGILTDRVDQAYKDRLSTLLHDLKIPTAFPKSRQRQMIEAMQHDKKNVDGQLRFVLPTRLGHVELVRSVTEEQVSKSMFLSE